MITIGIDPSINSTGICVNASDTYEYYIIGSKVTKKRKEYRHDRIHIIDYGKIDTKGMDYPDKEYHKSENIYHILGIIKDILNKYDWMEEEILVYMEGISYGSTGSAALADLSGLNFAIRMLLLAHGIEFRIISPISLKIFATNNAGADKEEMSRGWKLLDPEMSDIPEYVKIDDLADAYFLCRYK